MSPLRTEEIHRRMYKLAEELQEEGDVRDLLLEAGRAVGVLYDIIKEARAALRSGDGTVFRFGDETVGGSRAALRILELADEIPSPPRAQPEVRVVLR